MYSFHPFLPLLKQISPGTKQTPPKSFLESKETHVYHYIFLTFLPYFFLFLSFARRKKKHEQNTIDGHVTARVFPPKIAFFFHETMEVKRERIKSKGSQNKLEAIQSTTRKTTSAHTFRVPDDGAPESLLFPPITSYMYRKNIRAIR